MTLAVEFNLGVPISCASTVRSNSGKGSLSKNTGVIASNYSTMESADSESQYAGTLTIDISSVLTFKSFNV